MAYGRCRNAVALCGSSFQEQSVMSEGDHYVGAATIQPFVGHFTFEFCLASTEVPHLEETSDIRYITT